MKSVAIIGSGISGMTAAYLLQKKYNVSVFEKNDYIGGHTATKQVIVDKKEYAIDTGFIVFNDRTYPKFEKLLNEIDIGRQPTEMSFSVHNQNTGFEYNGHTLTTLFAQKRNVFKLRFWKFLYDITRFNKICKKMHDTKNFSHSPTLGIFLQSHGFSDYFKMHYILPMGAAIWSSSINDMMKFETEFFIKFFYNHGLLDIVNRPQWYVIPGGSKQYIKPLTAGFAKNIELNSTLKTVRRFDDKVHLVFANNDIKEFDLVVFACHSDEALSLIENPSIEETSILGDIPYTANSVILHTDESILPNRKNAWASWNYLLDGTTDKAAAVTYQMNILQGIKSETNFCVTLNKKEGIDPTKILQEFTYYHPVFNVQSIAAQKRKHEIDGKNNTYFCGAYWFNGFHEDGVKSAVDISQQLGINF